MKQWHFNVLFLIAAGGAVLLLLSPLIGYDAEIQKNPTVVTAYGAILTYVLTQRTNWVKSDQENGEKTKKKNGSKPDDSTSDDNNSTPSQGR